jgi:hypothetical protein
VQADYLADDAEQETVDMFFEEYLLWLFGFVLFCSSQGDAVARYPWTSCPRSVGQLCSCELVQGAVLGGIEASCDGADPSRLSFHSSALVPRAAIGRPVVALYAYEPLPKGHDPHDCFTMSSLW